MLSDGLHELRPFVVKNRLLLVVFKQTLSYLIHACILVKNRDVFVTLELRQLVLLEVWDELALILSHIDL